MAVRTTLLRSNPDTDPQTLATLARGHRHQRRHRAGRRRRPASRCSLEWVTMHDAKVRHTHKDTEGQQRPPGEKFDVGGTRLRLPGPPGRGPRDLDQLPVHSGAGTGK